MGRLMTVASAAACNRDGSPPPATSLASSFTTRTLSSIDALFIDNADGVDTTMPNMAVVDETSDPAAGADLLLRHAWSAYSSALTYSSAEHC